MEVKKVKLDTTNKGLPAIWESGGGYTNTGSSRIVCNADGSKKRAVYIRNRGDLACREHALFAVEQGDIVIDASHHRRDFSITVWRIKNVWEGEERTKKLVETAENLLPKEEVIKKAIYDYGEEGLLPDTYQVVKSFLGSYSHYVEYGHPATFAEMEAIHQFKRGEWDVEPPSYLNNAIEAAKKKATEYHCRSPYYYLPPVSKVEITNSQEAKEMGELEKELDNLEQIDVAEEKTGKGLKV